MAPILDLEPFREKLKQEMVNGLQGFNGNGPITRVDVWYDLVSMDVPMVRLYLDNHPTGEPSSGSSDEIDLMELEFPEWVNACHAENSVIKYSGKNRHRRRRIAVRGSRWLFAGDNSVNSR